MILVLLGIVIGAALSVAAFFATARSARAAKPVSPSDNPPIFEAHLQEHLDRLLRSAR